MQSTSAPPGAHAVEATVTIQRPVAEVFRYYRDLRNLPSFLGDVTAVEQVDPVTFRWTIQGPLGARVHWTVLVTEERANELIRYRTAGWGSSWEVHFSPGPNAGSTVVREVLRSP